jgi:histidyl-tRNA synthetase
MVGQLFLSLGLQHLTQQLNSIGCKECRPGYLAILKNYYAPHAEELCPDCKVRLIRNPLRLLDCKQTACQRIADAAPKSVDHLCSPCGTHFNQLKDYLKLLEIPFTVNHRLVRGLDYYTRTVFEIQPETGGSQSALGGGGRYDDLIEELGGKPTPAIGFAVGIERIILNLKKQSVPVPSLPGPLVFIAHVGDEGREEAIKLASRLRQAGTGTIVAVGNKSLKAQMRQANTLGVRYAVIIGEEEVKNRTASLRDMANAQQKIVPLSELPEHLG